jgi:hypothetical protein
MLVSFRRAHVWDRPAATATALVPVLFHRACKAGVKKTL